LLTSRLEEGLNFRKPPWFDTDKPGVLTSLNREKEEGMALLLSKVSGDSSQLNYLIIGVYPTWNGLRDLRGEPLTEP
jgi:hypothetical protein